VLSRREIGSSVCVFEHVSRYTSGTPSTGAKLCDAHIVYRPVSPSTSRDTRRVRLGDIQPSRKDPRGIYRIDLLKILSDVQVSQVHQPWQQRKPSSAHGGDARHFHVTFPTVISTFEEWLYSMKSGHRSPVRYYSNRFQSVGFATKLGRELPLLCEPPYGRRPGWYFNGKQLVSYTVRLRNISLVDLGHAWRCNISNRGRRFSPEQASRWIQGPEQMLRLCFAVSVCVDTARCCRVG
jgi:hypothetical protein